MGKNKWLTINLKLLMFIPMKTKIINFILLSIFIFANASPNPFLRPGSNKKPPPIFVAPKPTPQPIPQKDISKEIDFKGFFSLKGKYFFCIKNKKTNHSEWISFNQKTFENFEVKDFDVKTDTLTVLYENAPYKVSLSEGYASSNLSSKYKKPLKPIIPIPHPIKPIPNIKIPNRNLNFPKSKYYSPRKNQSGLPLPKNSSNPKSTTNFLLPNFKNSNKNAEFKNDKNLIAKIVKQPERVEIKDSIDLEMLPPPPPPPNISPPSPPPNILPSPEF